MRGVVMYGPGDVRVEEREVPRLVEPTDAILRVVASCICGSDLWPWRGLDAVGSPSPMVNALRRLGGLEPGALPQSIQASGITDKAGIMALFSTHPPIEERIRLLRAM